MAGTPREYLTLLQTGPSSNFAQYTAGGASPGTDVVTNYTRTRLDPATLLVDISDQTFASSTGSLLHSETVPVTSMPYGVAMDCEGAGSSTGRANVDLRGLPFKVTDTWVVGGFEASGTTNLTSNNQVVSVTGGGFCGWNAPALIYNPFNTNGGFDLQLASASLASTPTPTSTPTVTPTPTLLALGDPCTTGTRCASTFCAPGGVCCNAPCTQPGQSCNLPGSLGLCRLVSAAPAISLTVFLLLAVLLAAGGWLVLRRARE
jgi:hypothetical protein